MKKAMAKVVIFVLLWLSILASYNKSDPLPASEPEKGPPQEKILLIGLIPEQDLFRQAERYQPLTLYLSEKTGMKIRTKILSRYRNSIDNFISENLDGAFFGSFAYALAHAKLDVEALARPQLLNGESTYHGLILVRKSSGIQTAKQMKGKTFAFVDKATTAGYLLPLVYFKKNGIENFRTFFKETYFAGTHEGVIRDVLEGKADIGAAKNTVYQRMADRDGRAARELAVLDRSPEVPENGLAVRRALEDSIKKRIQEALLTMHLDPRGEEVLKKFGAQKFIETRDEDYLPVLQYARKANLNLATYDYRDE